MKIILNSLRYVAGTKQPSNITFLYSQELYMEQILAGIRVYFKYGLITMTDRHHRVGEGLIEKYFEHVRIIPFKLELRFLFSHAVTLPKCSTDRWCI